MGPLGRAGPWRDLSGRTGKEDLMFIHGWLILYEVSGQVGRLEGGRLHKMRKVILRMRCCQNAGSQIVQHAALSYQTRSLADSLGFYK